MLFAKKTTRYYKGKKNRSPCRFLVAVGKIEEHITLDFQGFLKGLFPCVNFLPKLFWLFFFSLCFVSLSF